MFVIGDIKGVVSAIEYLENITEIHLISEMGKYRGKRIFGEVNTRLDDIIISSGLKVGDRVQIFYTIDNSWVYKILKSGE